MPFLRSNFVNNAIVAHSYPNVSPTSMGFSTGDGKLTLKTAADPGWVLCDDGTIGSGSSGASNRANSDCQALFLLLWTNCADADAPVTGGRGASAAADWAANKKIALTKQLGYSIAIAGAGSGLTARTLGHVDGHETHAITPSEAPAITDPGISIPQGDGSSGSQTVASGAGYSGANGTAHDIMNPRTYWNIMIKL